VRVVLLVHLGVNHLVDHIYYLSIHREVLMKKLIRSEKGQGLVEYALILVLVAIVVIGILLIMGPTVGNVFSNIVDNLVKFSGGGNYTVTLNGTPSVSRNPSGFGCTYSATVPVRATQGGNPASGASVSASITILNGGTNPIGSFSVSGTTNGSGLASVSGSSGDFGCSGDTATVSVNSGSMTVAVP
jgi:pilus assembly protein Flp/PilA